MTKSLFRTRTLAFAVAGFVAATVAVTACKKDKKNQAGNAIEFQDYSVNPALVKAMTGFEGLKITTLISSDDVLPESPGFIFGAQPDGAGRRIHHDQQSRNLTVGIQSIS